MRDVHASKKIIGGKSELGIIINWMCIGQNDEHWLPLIPPFYLPISGVFIFYRTNVFTVHSKRIMNIASHLAFSFMLIKNLEIFYIFRHKKCHRMI
jgi:hypothetical protein